MSLPECSEDPGTAIAEAAVGENPFAGAPYERHPPDEAYSKGAEASGGPAMRQDSTESDVLIVDPAKLPTFYAAIRLSVMTILLSLAAGINGPAYTELMKMRMCEGGLNLSSSICNNINEPSYKLHADAVRSETAKYQLYGTLIGTLPSIFFSVFVGSWSDRFGRKLPMMLPFVGMCVSVAYISVIANFNLHPAYLLVSSALSSITGGWTIILMAKFSYIGDYTTEKTRAMNIAVIDGFLVLFGNAGGLVGGYVFQNLGMVVPFYITTGLYACCFLYVLLVIRDRKTRDKRERHGALFSVSNFLDNFRMLRKERMGDTRLHFRLVIGALLLYSVTISGDSSIMQLFVEFEPFKWTIEFYTIFSCIQGIVTSVAIIFAMAFLRKFLGMPDTTIAFLASISTILMYFGYGIAKASWVLYVSSVFGIMRILVIVCIRAIMSCLVDENEIGKSMSLISSLQSITPLLGSVIFTDLFAATSSWWSGLCFVVGAFFLVPVMAVFAYVDVMRRRNVYHAGFEYKPLTGQINVSH